MLRGVTDLQPISSKKKLSHEMSDQPNKLPCTEIDEIFIRTGCGQFQIILTIMLFMIQIAITVQTFNLYFVGHDPAWKCVSANSSEFCSKHEGETFGRKTIDLFQRRCSMNESEWMYTKPKAYSLVTEVSLFLLISLD